MLRENRKEERKPKPFWGGPTLKRTDPLLSFSFFRLGQIATLRTTWFPNLRETFGVSLGWVYFFELIPFSPWFKRGIYIYIYFRRTPDLILWVVPILTPHPAPSGAFARTRTEASTGRAGVCQLKEGRVPIHQVHEATRVPRLFFPPSTRRMMRDWHPRAWLFEGITIEIDRWKHNKHSREAKDYSV